LVAKLQVSKEGFLSGACFAMKKPDGKLPTALTNVRFVEIIGNGLMAAMALTGTLTKKKMG